MKIVNQGCRILLLLFVLGSFNLQSQEDERTLLRGQVLYRNVNVPNENVINSTSQRATITNDNGEFAIRVKVDDELVFTSINYQIEMIKITQEILDNNRLVVEVNEKVTALDEVVVSPENQERFLQLQNEEFKGYEYETDQSTEVVNIAQDKISRGLLKDGINFVNIFKALVNTDGTKKDNPDEPLKTSEVLRLVYEDDFFTEDLNIPEDKIDAFLYYCDEQLPPKSLLKKDNEFELIDFLVNQSNSFLEMYDKD
ncbi:carboxypeptidase-like regulatory domain-containing protein [Eudoraea chungangensis]|uniref:carboxypeptidase-like regulatory domain-containing protein n=1 Tax=Eudoraea chungangensis TaxID=1481905 RepID=UPI0023EAEF3C|nr:carboxypeptidase-like regulatory domain-containing protein [Eudoraea chungangensis]